MHTIQFDPPADLQGKAWGLSREAIYGSLAPRLAELAVVQRDQRLRVEIDVQARFIAESDQKLAAIDERCTKLIGDAEPGFADELRSLPKEKASLAADLDQAKAMLGLLRTKQSQTSKLATSDLHSLIADAVSAQDKLLAARETELNAKLREVAGTILDEIGVVAQARQELSIYPDWKNGLAVRLLRVAQPAVALATAK